MQISTFMEKIKIVFSVYSKMSPKDLRITLKESSLKALSSHAMKNKF